MKSSDLAQLGFKSWSQFNRENERNLVSTLPEDPGVYVVRSSKDYPGEVRASDILYIGMATNRHGLKGRVRQYFHPGPTQHTNRRILARVTGQSSCSLSFVVTKSVPEARMLETSLLRMYEIDHGELPPENLRH